MISSHTLMRKLSIVLFIASTLISCEAETERFNNPLYQHRILILDFGSQYSQLIARRIREIGVYCELHTHTMSEKEIAEFAPSGIILSGGPESVTQENTPRAPECVFKLDCPVLGICYGMQTMAEQLGGTVQSCSKREFGHAQVALHKQSLLFDGLECQETLDVWMSHGDHVVTLPEGFTCLARSSNTPIVAMADLKRQLYGVQFHPEVSHTAYGEKLLKNFVVEICKCRCLWREEQIIEHLTAMIQKKVGTDHVLLAVSGGVDSSVLALLLHRAIGNQLHCVLVDNGLLRFNEVNQVLAIFEKLGINITCVNARDHFLHALAGKHDPEEKRKIIGHEFIHIFEEQAKHCSNATWLGQGTIYPDVIESGQSKSGKAHKIKSHHNVGGLPAYMKLNLIEPLRDLFKDEVRKIGLQMGLAREIVYRHPFPGAGLGIRIIGEVKKEYLDTLAHVDAIFIEELRNFSLYDQVSQAAAIFLPIKSVGIKGDARCYEHVVALRAVETIDFMTARWSHLPHDFLSHVSGRILNEVPGVARVVYDISDKPPATIEWE